MIILVEMLRGTETWPAPEDHIHCMTFIQEVCAKTFIVNHVTVSVCQPCFPSKHGCCACSFLFFNPRNFNKSVKGCKQIATCRSNGEFHCRREKQTARLKQKIAPEKIKDMQGRNGVGWDWIQAWMKTPKGINEFRSFEVFMKILHLHNIFSQWAVNPHTQLPVNPTATLNYLNCISSSPCFTKYHILLL